MMSYSETEDLAFQNQVFLEGTVRTIPMLLDQ
jgi:hypothetical protein